MLFALGKIVEKVLAAPLWYVLPVVLVAGAVGVTVVQHNPLSFDTSVFQPKTATADELGVIDAQQLEEEALGEPRTLAGAADGATALADGTYTGYAVCGMGNPDGWKPYYVGVTISVSGGRVDGVTSVFGSSTDESGGAALQWDAAENQEYLDWAAYGRNGQTGVVAQINDQLATNGSVSAIDTVSGATYSAESIYNGYLSATKGGGSAAGSAAASMNSAGNEKTGSSVSVAEQNLEGIADGTYTGYASCGIGNEDDWKPYYVGVSVKVANGKATGITKVFGSSTGGQTDSPLQWDASENQKYLDWAADGKNSQTGVVNQINSKLSAGESVTSIDTVGGATYSSYSILDGYIAALKNGAKASPDAASSSSSRNPIKPSSNPSSKQPSSSSGQKVKPKLGALADGTWIAYASCGEGNEDEWSAYYVGVAVKVEKGKVAGITDIYGSSLGDKGQKELLWISSENKAYLDWAIEGRKRSGREYAGVKKQVEDALAQGKTLQSIDAVSGATYSSDSIFAAYVAALEKSAAAAKLAVGDEQEAEEESGGSGSGSSDSQQGSLAISIDNGNGDTGGTGGSGGSGGTGDTGDSGNAGGSSSSGDTGSSEDGIGGGPGSQDDNSGGGGSSGGEDGDNPTSDDTNENIVSVTGAFPDGTYTGYALCQDSDDPTAWAPYCLVVTVEAKDGRIVSVGNIYGDANGSIDARYVYDHKENGSYLNRAINGFGIRTKGVKHKIQTQLNAGDSVETIDTVSGATWSSVSIYDAFKHAVANAKAAA